jgi:hypothetical protein
MFAILFLLLCSLSKINVDVVIFIVYYAIMRTWGVDRI